MDKVRRVAIVLVLAFVGWALCAVIIGLGMAVTSQSNALIAHAIGAPVVFTLISLLYFKKFQYTTPIQTAMIFLTFVILMDFFVVAMMIMRSFEMFASALGTWTPFALIFLSTYGTGLYVGKRA